VHDYLNQRGGAERVFRHVADLYADAPVYTSLFDPAATGDLVAPERVHVSPLDRIPGSRRFFRALAPLYPWAFERFDLAAYDTIVSTTTSWAKGVRFRDGAVHVSYIHTVSRFAFDYDRYVGGFGLATLARPLVARLVRWDRRAAERPTAFVANSANVAARVRRYYGREAFVVPCPVDVERFAPAPLAEVGDRYLVVSRLLGYKRVDLAIDACRLAGARLAVVGEGPARAALERRAAGSRTEFLGALCDDALRSLMARARAVILPGEEDFGLVPLEAAASGRPAIAYGRGGALETIVAETGTWFAEPTAESLAAALCAFDPNRYDRAIMRMHAERFSPARFAARFGAVVDEVRALGSRAAVDAELGRRAQERERLASVTPAAVERIGGFAELG